MKSSNHRKEPAFLALLIFISLISFLLVKCKREVSATTEKPTSLSGMSEGMMAQIKKDGLRTEIPLNIITPGFILDKDGNVFHPNKKTAKTYGTLDTPPAVCDNPGDFSPAGPHQLHYIRNIQSQCGDFPHTLSATWTIRSPFELVEESPFSPTFKSVGKIRFKFGNTVVLQNLNIPISTSDIVFEGMDPGDPDLYIYTVSYAWSGIDDAYFNSSATTSIEFAVLLYSDCPDIPWSVTSPYQPSALWPFYSNLAMPCARIDFGSIYPYQDLWEVPDYKLCGTVSGTDVLGFCPSPPDYYINLASQVQVKWVGDITNQWYDVRTYGLGLSDYRDEFGPKLGLIYNHEVRYLEQFQNYIDGLDSTAFPASFVFKWRNHDSTGTAPNKQPCLGEWSAESAPVTFKDFFQP